MLQTIKYTVCRRVCAHSKVSKEILQAGTVKGLIVPVINDNWSQLFHKDRYEPLPARRGVQLVMGDWGLYESGYETEHWIYIGHNTERHFTDNKMLGLDL